MCFPSRRKFSPYPYCALLAKTRYPRITISKLTAATRNHHGNTHSWFLQCAAQVYHLCLLQMLIWSTAQQLKNQKWISKCQRKKKIIRYRSDSNRSGRFHQSRACRCKLTHYSELKRSSPFIYLILGENGDCIDRMRGCHLIFT